MRRSAVAAERREYGRAVTLAVAACDQAEPVGPRVKALALRQRSIAHALIHEAGPSERASHAALETVHEAGPAHSLEYCTPAYVAMEVGFSAFHLRRLDIAAERLTAAAAAWPAGFARDQGLCLARLAVVEVTRGRVEAACAVGQDAVSVARNADSARTRATLASLRQRLSAYDRSPSVAELRHQLAALGRPSQ